MAYTILKSDGSTLALISGNTVDTTSTPLTLYGRGRLMWGQGMDENLVHLLENFNSDAAPTPPLQGQLWHDSSTLTLNYWDGSQWVPLSTFTGFGSPPAFGETFFDGDIIFTIPSSGLPDDSKGIIWVGNTDQMQIYVEEKLNERSEWIFEVSDNADTSAGSVIGDGLSIRHKQSGQT